MGVGIFDMRNTVWGMRRKGREIEDDSEKIRLCEMGEGYAATRARAHGMVC